MKKATGSIYLRKDGRYEERCKDAKGEKILYFYGKSRNEVCNKMNTFWKAQSYCQSELTGKKLFEEWLANYLGKAECHILPEFGNILADRLNASHVQQFVAKN